MKKYVIKKGISSILYLIFSLYIEILMLKFLKMGFLPSYWFVDLFSFVIIALILFLIPMRAQNIITTILLSIETIFCYVVICVFASTKRIFSWDLLNLLEETTKVIGMGVFPILQLFLILIPLIIFITLWIVFKKVGKESSYKQFLKSIRTIIVSFFLIVSIAIQSLAPTLFVNLYSEDEYFTSISYHYSSFDQPHISLLHFGLFGYYFTDIARKIFPSLKPDLKLSPTDYTFEFYDSDLTGVCADENVIFIFAESFEKYAISKKLTPVLYSLLNGADLTDVGISNFYNVTTDDSGKRTLSRKDYIINSETGNYIDNDINIYNNIEFEKFGLNLSNYRSYEATKAAELGVLTGSYNRQEDYRLLSAIGAYSLPTLLKSSGYSTTYIHGNYAEFYDRENYINPVIGFENTIFYDNLKGHIESTEKLNEFVRDSDIINYCLSNNNIDILSDEKFFTFMMTITTHSTYEEKSLLTDHYKLFDTIANSNTTDDVIKVYNSLEDQTLKNVARTYLAGAIDTELSVAMLIDELFKTNKLNNTTLVFVADHWAHSNDIESFKKIFYQDVYNIDCVGGYEYDIPAFIYSTKLTSSFINSTGYSRSLNHLTSTYDLTPTILTLLGIDYKQEYYLGFPVINKSKITEKLASNNITYSTTCGQFVGLDYVYYSPDNIVCNRPLSAEDVALITKHINNFQKKRFFITYTLTQKNDYQITI